MSGNLWKVNKAKASNGIKKKNKDKLALYVVNVALIYVGLYL